MSSRRRKRNTDAALKEVVNGMVDGVSATVALEVLVRVRTEREVRVEANSLLRSVIKSMLGEIVSEV